MASKTQSKDATARLILGIILVLIALPVFGMLLGGMSYNYGMMGMMYPGGGGFGILVLLVTLAIIVLGLFLIFENLKR